MKTRNEIPEEDRWNVEALYPSLETWEAEFTATISKDSPRFPRVSKNKGKLAQGPGIVLDTLNTMLDLDRKLTKLYTYAHTKHDEEISNETYKSAYSKIFSAYHAFAEETSWFEPELVALSDEEQKKLLHSPELANYRFYLEKIIRNKPHTLSPEQEYLSAQASRAMATSGKAFSTLNDADLSFGTAVDSKGEKHPITHATYRTLQQSRDRTLRESAFKTYHNSFAGFQNTFCELLNGKVEAHRFQARSHNYKNCLEAALFPKNIDVSVYHSLIEAVNENLQTLHHYIALRKKILAVDTLHLWDMYVPLTEEIEITMGYKEAEDAVIASVAPLGAAYQNRLREGLKNQRWVDRYENKDKRSGAYSSGCYDSSPYILMNYNGTLRDVFTLAHEAGHSMHSHLSHTHQPYHYSDYPIFLAEVASTFNEDLLTRHLLERSSSEAEKIYLINQKIEDIRATLFRQTMFAEFELKIHTLVEDNIPLTPQLLTDSYKTLNEKYFGKAAHIDSEGMIEWARIPHFYYNFYVYQYATGISAALALSQRVISGGNQEREEYLGFLKGGCSKYPIDLLKIAGVDMGTKLPVSAAIESFGNLVNDLAGVSGLSRSI